MIFLYFLFFSVINTQFFKKKLISKILISYYKLISEIENDYIYMIMEFYFDLMNVKKTNVMVFNSVDPCQEFVFKGDTIECVHTFK
jgi:hypothetical protein